MIKLRELLRDGQVYTFAPLPGMTEAEVDALLGISQPKEVNTKTYTAKEVAKLYLAAELKRLALQKGLNAKGGELLVAQRLLDSGWKPDAN